MIAVDTNVLVRYMVCDDAEQARLARSLLEKLSSNRPGLISREVAIELVWVLERAYRFSRDQIVSVLEELVSTEGLVVEAADDVVRASSSYRRGGVCFSDLMILAAVERAGSQAGLYLRPRLREIGRSSFGGGCDNRRVAMKDAQKPDQGAATTNSTTSGRVEL